MTVGGRGIILVALLGLAGCPTTPFTTCDVEPDLTGHWSLSLTPAGDNPISRPDTIDAMLRQTERPGLGSFVWGTLASSDKGFFDSLQIPELTKNNGGKTGGVLGCSVKINVPVTSMVTNDDTDNGPLRLSLSGSVAAGGMMKGDVSTVIPIDDSSMRQGTFTWTGVQQQ
jgi:hypothetical protein